MYEKLNRLTAPKARLLAFIKAQIETSIPFQMRALRGKRSQGEMAALTGIKQPRISILERPGSGNIEINTLAEYAAANRIGLIVRFAPVSEMVEWQENFFPDH